MPGLSGSQKDLRTQRGRYDTVFYKYLFNLLTMTEGTYVCQLPMTALLFIPSILYRIEVPGTPQRASTLAFLPGRRACSALTSIKGREQLSFVAADANCGSDQGKYLEIHQLVDLTKVNTYRSTRSWICSG